METCIHSRDQFCGFSANWRQAVCGANSHVRFSSLHMAGERPGKQVRQETAKRKVANNISIDNCKEVECTDG